MAQAKRKTEWNAALQVATPAIAERALPNAASPARALQQLLEERAGLVAGEARWSRRRSVALIVSLSASLWMALLTISHTAVIGLA